MTPHASHIRLQKYIQSMRYARWQQYATRCEVMVSEFNGWDSKQKRAKKKKKMEKIREE